MVSPVTKEKLRRCVNKALDNGGEYTHPDGDYSCEVVGRTVIDGDQYTRFEISVSDDCMSIGLEENSFHTVKRSVAKKANDRHDYIYNA